MKRLPLLLAAALFLSSQAARAQTLDIIGSAWAPYQMMEKDTPAGLGTEVIQQVIKKMGASCTFRLIPWERCIREYERGDADAIYLISPNPERKKFLIFPETPIVTSTYVFFIRKDAGKKLRFDSYRDLAGHTVGITSGYSYSPEFWEGVKSSAGVQSTSTDEQNFLKLANGRFDYFPCDVYVGADLIRKLGIEDKVTFLDKPVLRKDYFIAFCINSKFPKLPDFTSRFDSALREFVSSQGYREIMKKYLP
ncbi:MAG: transporter substrate-binding domain-containing protein [Thermodesulfobacteriota bacterium]